MNNPLPTNNTLIKGAAKAIRSQVATVTAPLLLSAVIGLGIYIYKHDSNAKTKKIDMLISGMEAAGAARASALTLINRNTTVNARQDSDIKALNGFAREGGRYPREQALQDWARQVRIDDKQDREIERLNSAVWGNP